MTDTLTEDLVATLEAMRRAERELFAGLDPALRDRPLRAGDWSPKDHQAHLSAWKRRQADRYAAVREGRPLPTGGGEHETDAINAELQATRADWSWVDIEREADEVSERLIGEIRASDPAAVRESGRLIAGTFGNGVLHGLTHFRWLQEAGIGVDAELTHRFAEEVDRLVRAESLPPGDRAIGLYDLACHLALSDQTDAARPLLAEAFRLDPELVTHARTDADLASLAGELDDLAAAGVES